MPNAGRLAVHDDVHDVASWLWFASGMDGQRDRLRELDFTPSADDNPLHLEDFSRGFAAGLHEMDAEVDEKLLLRP